jgi:hypothetical protein
MRGIFVLLVSFLSSVVVAQTSRPKSPEDPASCIAFDTMAARVEGIRVEQEITESEFRDAEKRATTIRKPGKVFDVGAVEYVLDERNGKPVFGEVTHNDEKKAEFLRWYNRSGGSTQISDTGMECFLAYSRQVQHSTGRQQAELREQSIEVWLAVSTAAQIANDSLKETVKAESHTISALSDDLEGLSNRYNEVVQNDDAYDAAVSKYVKIVNQIMTKQHMPMPTFQVNSVRRQPITCTGNINSFSRAVPYPGSVDTTTMANTPIHCQ